MMRSNSIPMFIIEEKTQVIQKGRKQMDKTVRHPTDYEKSQVSEIWACSSVKLLRAVRQEPLPD